MFALFKRHLAEAAQTVAVSAEGGHVPLTALVKVVCDIIVKVIRGRSWANAFSDIGLVGHQTAVSQSVLGKLKLAAAPPRGRWSTYLGNVTRNLACRCHYPHRCSFCHRFKICSTEARWAQAGRAVCTAGRGPGSIQRGGSGVFCAMADGGEVLERSSSPRAGAYSSPPVGGPGAAPARAADAESTQQPTAFDVGEGDGEFLLKSIDRLKDEQAKLRAEKKKVAKDLRNAEKKRSRLKKRARQLSDVDLVTVLQIRKSMTAGKSSDVQAKDAEKGVHKERDA